MKSKLLILLLFVSFATMGQRLPINGLCLSNVLGVTGGTCLSNAFTNANSGYFDPAYAVSGNCLADFRNYGNSLPSVTTAAATSIARWSATLGGNVTADGGSTVTARGVCSATTQNPTTSPVSMGSGLGVFGQTVGGMSPGTLYYVRAYATNSSGTTYGDQISFTTSADIPTMTATYISGNVAPPSYVVSEMNITSLGGANITDMGLCWSTSNSTPTKADTYYSSGGTANGTGAASFEVPYTNFSQCQSYFARFYATNIAGTGYSNMIQFTYYCPVTAPTVSTNNGCFIDADNAFLEGTVNADNGATVTARGFCWSYSNTDPSTSDSSQGVGSGTGYFSWSPNGLFSQSTNIYIRAYATNSAGTSYGTVYTINSDLLCN